MTDENGTARLLPFTRVGIRTLVEHVRDEQSGDKIGYLVTKQACLQSYPPGVWSSSVRWCFTQVAPNRTDTMRARLRNAVFPGTDLPA